MTNVIKYTQEQLEEMSDFEINKIAAELNGMDYSGVSEQMKHDYNMPDYCNNWSDMGPLIHRYKIAMTPQGWNTTLWSASTSINCDMTSISSNPLRAAAVVYILIKQGV
ncbi:MAG TPA: phage protein NinX family protein [Psychromonas sp.]